jgi:hypothetical protein
MMNGVFDDPNSPLIKLRQFGELMTQHAVACVGIAAEERETQADLLNKLRDRSTDRKFKRQFRPPPSPPAAAARSQRRRFPQHATTACESGAQQGVARLSVG